MHISKIQVKNKKSPVIRTFFSVNIRLLDMDLSVSLFCFGNKNFAYAYFLRHLISK